MESTSLHREIIEAIESWPVDGGGLQWSDRRFNGLARQLFAHQYATNRPYRRLCDRRGIGPDDTPAWQQIPAVPTDAFKQVRLWGGDNSPEHTFRTSGTASEVRGEHHFRTLAVYRASLHPTFVRFCNPAEDRLRMLIIAPPPDELPDSSLSFMLGELLERHGDLQSGFYVSLDERNRWKFAADALGAAVDNACADEAPTLLFGTAFGFAEFFEQVDACWQLPPGSRLVETGGFKGRVQNVSRDQLYRAFSNRLGLSRSQCLSEYSMTELSSQAYTDHLTAGSSATGRFYTPPWLRVDIVDPVSLTPLEERGEPGLIRFFDLANVDSVSAIQTSDRGILHDDGSLELRGRAPDSDLRGCSLTIEEIVEGTDPRSPD